LRCRCALAVRGADVGIVDGCWRCRCCWREGNREIGRVSFDMVICLCKHSRRAVHYVEGGVFQRGRERRAGKASAFLSPGGVLVSARCAFPDGETFIRTGR